MAHRSILIVTPHFAPESHAAVFRAYKLARHLPAMGWEVHVLTVDTNYNYLEDPQLIAALPRNVHIHRARYIEPSLRGLRRLMRKGEFGSGAKKPPFSPPSVSASASKTALKSLYHRLLARFLFVPDAFWTWTNPAIRAAKKIMRETQTEVFMTSAPPYSMAKIGKALKKEGFKWLADMRDPMLSDHRLTSSYSAVFSRQKNAVDAMVLGADAVSLASSSAGLLLSDQYGARVSSKLHFIPTGLDRALLPRQTQAPVSEPYFVFSGEYLPQYGEEFLRAFADALKQSKQSARLYLIGRLAINAPIVQPIIDRLGLQDSVILKDHLPQSELYVWIAHAQAAVLIGATQFRWAILYAKLIDYLAMKKPVIALVPDPSEARKWLQRTGLGIFLDGSLTEQSALLARVVEEGPSKFVQPVPRECERFGVEHQVRAFSEVLDSALQSGRTNHHRAA